jgi:hypothetical protein
MAEFKPFKFPRGILKRVREMVITSPVTVGLRNTLSALRSGFFEAPTTPALQDTKINRDAARALYYNTAPNMRYGAFIARNIIDGTSDYMGLPILTVGDENTDEEINTWITEHWASDLWQLYRTTLRDADAWVRIRLPLPSPLLAPGEEKIPEIEVIDSDRVTAYYHPSTRELERVEILTDVYIEDEPFNPANIYATGARSHGRAHEIIEIITKDQYLYWDATTNEFLDALTVNNDWNFVPLVQVFNDYDEALHGGSSDLENIYPLLQPFHDIFDQTKTAFGYHANPKVQVQVGDILTFIRNNFPDALTDDGKFTGKVSWRDKDVFFMETGDTGTTNESMSFVTANLNIAEAQALLELIIDVICIGAGVTEGVLFRAQAEGSDTSDEAQRFKKKVGRKRDNVAPYLRSILRMAMLVAMGNPITPQITWPEIDSQDLIDYSTAFANTVTALEILSRSTIISKTTYRASVRRFVPNMKKDAEEAVDAQKDIQQENQDQVDLEKQLAEINPSIPPANSNNGGGPNSPTRSRRVRAALPLQVISSQPGE